ncbi:MAG: hypothetical protein KF754_01720 [Planctomycetes bacterium]|nr:hypothetical protein [Planctomycetota bacterium]
MIQQIITYTVLGIRDEKKWKKMQEKKEDTARSLLGSCSDNWDEVKEFLIGTFGSDDE